MARLRHTARKSVIPFLPSRLAERPLRRPVAGQSSHVERLHHRLREEQERRRQAIRFQLALRNVIGKLRTRAQAELISMPIERMLKALTQGQLSLIHI